MAGFVDELTLINALADAAPGFVWRLVGEDGGRRDRPAAVRAGPDGEHVGLGVGRGAARLHLPRRQPPGFAAPATGVVSARRARRAPGAVVGAGRHGCPRWRRRGSGWRCSTGDGPGPEAFTLREPYPAPAALRKRRPIGGPASRSRAASGGSGAESRWPWPSRQPRSSSGARCCPRSRCPRRPRPAERVGDRQRSPARCRGRCRVAVTPPRTNGRS